MYREYDALDYFINMGERVNWAPKHLSLYNNVLDVPLKHSFLPLLYDELIKPLSDTLIFYGANGVWIERLHIFFYIIIVHWYNYILSMFHMNRIYTP